MDFLEHKKRSCRCSSTNQQNANCIVTLLAQFLKLMMSRIRIVVLLTQDVCCQFLYVVFQAEDAASK